MNPIIEFIEIAKSLFELADRFHGKKRREEDLRVSFHITTRFEDFTPIPEILIVNTSDLPQTVENLFAVVGNFRKKYFPLFVEWGERELPQVIQKGDKLLLHLAERGTIEEVATYENIRVGVITDLNDRFVSDRIDEWHKDKLRFALGLVH